MELAMEMSANEFIVEPLPSRAVTWQDWQRFGIQARQSTMERYELLAAAARKGRVPLIMPGFPIDTHLGDGVGAVWGGLAPDEAARHRAREIVSGLGHDAAAARGRLIAGRHPLDLLETLGGSTAASRGVDWWSALRDFVGRSGGWEFTFSRPNRRFPDLIGEVPGRAHGAGSRPHILVAIDTSGSMSSSQLRMVAHELRRLRGLASFFVAECDARIQRVYRFSGALDAVKGRGGTDLRPVFDAAFLRRARPAGVVYFTDGDGPFPEAAPGVPTLWVLTAPFAFPCPWGRRVYLH